MTFMLPSWSRRSSTSLLVIGGLLLGADARADASASDKAAAESLFVDARRLMQEGKYAEACPKLVESQRLDPGLGTLLHLADCYEKSGRTASAWATFREAEGVAHERGERERERVAHDRAAALDAKISMLTVTVAPENAAIEVRRDGELLRPAYWGTPIAVDPGEHAVDATAPGKKRWSTKVVVAANGAKVTVAVPSLENEPATPPVAAARPVTSAVPPAVASEAPSAPPPRPAPREQASDGSTERILGYASLGVGAAAIVGGLFLKLASSAKHDDAQAHCTPTCDAGGGTALNDDAKTLAAFSTVSFVAGGLLAATGVVLLVRAPSSPSSGATALSVRSSVAPGSAGLSFGGVF